MKLWIAMFLVLVAIVVGGIVIERSILKTTDQLSHELDQLQQHVKSERWYEAKQLSNTIEEYWSQQQKRWIPFIHNQELDVITENLALIVSFLNSEEQSDILAEIAVLKVRLVQLHHQEILTITNIF